jgi:glycerophosphoryl diester phosphodiesterase
MGHRGAKGSLPENTFVSFDRARQEGVNILESDMQITKDGVVVLFHDDTVDRVTNGTGLVEEFTLAQLKELDAAYSFSLDGGVTFPLRGKGHTVPTLKEAFDRYPDMRFNLDLKSKNPKLVEKVIENIRDNNREDTVALASFYHKPIKKVRKQAEKAGLDIMTCASNFEIVKLLVASKLGLPSYKKPMALEVPRKSGSINVITDKFIKYAHDNNHHVIAWTINDKKEMSELIEMGVDGIITDYPGDGVDVARKFNAT